MEKIIAHRSSGPQSAPIRVAPREREWMDNLDHKYAYRCLPLVMANQFGWEVLSTHHIRATWDGRYPLDALKVEDLGGEGPLCWSSHFGGGILTFSVPYLIKTPPGWNLFVRGPTNTAKDGIAPLDGIVETDWSHATFTMNWRFTRACTVEFAIGEPACMFYPVERKLFDRFEPEMVDLESNPELHAKFKAWSGGRDQFNKDLKGFIDEAVKQGWQKDYFQGAEETKPRPLPFRSPT
jgi:hypothetical protein